MYAYAAVKAGEMNEYYDNYDYDKDSSTISKPREIAYWRKHPNLHGWMRRLWIEKGHSGDFNGDELELTWEDIDRLEKDVQSKNLPDTTGFFFGSESDDFYKDADLAFIKNARVELFSGLKVFYNSSW
jgi:hypothetical protein